MASNNIVGDGPADWQVVAEEAIHIAVAGTFGGGIITVEQDINGSVYPLLNEGVAITFAVDTDIRVNTAVGDKVRLNMAGATAPDVDFNIAGASLER